MHELAQLVDQKHLLAENFRKAITEQMNILGPAFPTGNEIVKAHEILKAYDDIDPETTAILHFAYTFKSAYEDEKVLWLGKSVTDASQNKNVGITEKGTLAYYDTYTSDQQMEGAPDSDISSYGYDNDDNEILERGERFLCKDQQELETLLHSWRYARGLIVEYSQRLKKKKQEQSLQEFIQMQNKQSVKTE